MNKKKYLTTIMQFIQGKLDERALREQLRRNVNKLKS